MFPFSISIPGLSVLATHARIERRAFRAVRPIFDCEDSEPYKSLDKGAKAQLYVKELVLSGISKISV